MLAAGHVKATDASSKHVDAKSLDRARLTQASFQREVVNISPTQFIKIRSLFSAVGLPCPPKEELARLPALLAKLKEQAARAGGAAPAPEVPKLGMLESIEAQAGNAQLLELFTRYDELVGLSKAWTRTADDIGKRLPVWRKLAGLLRHAKVLGPYATLKAVVDAIEAQRSLLSEPDPVRPLLDKTTDLLRHALNAKLGGFQEAFQRQEALLQADANMQNIRLAQPTYRG